MIEKIKRFNQPNCKESMRKEKSSSTTKLRNNNAFQMKHNEVKSMPEIQTAAKNTVYIKNQKKSNLTKLPKL